MKILLVEPHKPAKSIGGDDVFIYEPLALEYVAAGVSDTHEVRIVDLRLDKDFQRALDEFGPDIVGITAFTAHVNVVRGLFAQIKKWRPQTLTVVGGHHATVLPEDFISPDIDLIVMGEGVFAFREIVARHANGRPFADIPGVCCMKGTEFIRNESIEITDMDSFPFPDRKLTARYRKQYYSEWMKPLASIRTSRGCPYRCSFCAQWKLAKGKYLKREPQKIVEELKEIQEENIFFADDESLIDVTRMTELANLIRETGIRKRYFLYGRSDTISRHPELIRLWRDIGLERVFVGFEFFREVDLEYVRKKSTLKDNEEAVAVLRALAIEVYASFIVRQEFTESDFAELRKYCRKLGLAFASFAVLTPLPGTDLHAEVADRMITQDYDLIDFLHTQLSTTLPLKQFYAELAGLYANGTSLGKRLWMLRKFPLREIPLWINKGRQIDKRLRNAHLDYEA